MPSDNTFNSIEMSVLHDAFEIAVDTLREKHKIAVPKIDVLARLILEIGHRRVRTGIGLKAEEDAKSVAAYAAAILTKTDPR